MGPMEFIAYTEENVANIDNRTINHHLYADDIQLLAKMQIANMLPIKCELEKNSVKTTLLLLIQTTVSESSED